MDFRLDDGQLALQETALVRSAPYAAAAVLDNTYGASGAHALAIASNPEAELA